MSKVMESIKKRAAELKKHIVLPEGEDSRVVEAAAKAVKEGIASVTLLGDEKSIRENNPGVDLSGVNIVNPKTSDKLPVYQKLLYDLRKSKGMTEEQALETAKDNTYFGVLMLKNGDVDGLVSGACHSTANTLRPGLQIIKTAPGVPLVSSYFLMVAPECGNQYCEDGAYIYSDCGLKENPNSDELAYIAIASAKSAEIIAGLSPRIAMLSFST